MARSNYAAGKRAREAEKAKKKKDKAERRRRKREDGPTEVPIASAEEIAVAALSEPEREPGQPKERPPEPCRLFVGGLSWDTEEDELKKAFAAHGEVLEARVILDRDGRSRGFGFVTMADIKDAKVAMQALDGSELNGRALRVSPATDR